MAYSIRQRAITAFAAFTMFTGAMLANGNPFPRANAETKPTAPIETVVDNNKVEMTMKPEITGKAPLPRARPVQTAAVSTDVRPTEMRVERPARNLAATRTAHPQAEVRRERAVRQQGAVVQQEPNFFQKAVSDIRRFVAGEPTPMSAYTPVEREVKKTLLAMNHSPYVRGIQGVAFKGAKQIQNGTKHVDGSAWILRDGSVAQYTDAAIFRVKAQKIPRGADLATLFRIDGEFASKNGERLEMETGEKYIAIRQGLNEATKNIAPAIIAAPVGSALGVTNIFAAAAIKAVPKAAVDTIADRVSYYGDDDANNNPNRFIRRNGIRAVGTYVKALAGEAVDRWITKTFDKEATNIQRNGATQAKQIHDTAATNYQSAVTNYQSVIATRGVTQQQVNAAAAQVRATQTQLVSENARATAVYGTSVVKATDKHNLGETLGNAGRQVTNITGERVVNRPAKKLFDHVRRVDMHKAAGVSYEPGRPKHSRSSPGADYGKGLYR